MAQLPLYVYRNSKTSGTTRRWKEYYLLVITIVGFVILFAGVLWFVPGLEENRSYDKAYDSFTGQGPIDFTRIKQHEGFKDNIVNEDILKRDVSVGHDPDPRQRRLEEEVVPVPGRGRPNNIEDGQYQQTDGVVDSVSREEPVKDQGEKDKGEGITIQREESESEHVQLESNDAPVFHDEEARQRREKVKEVSQ